MNKADYNPKDVPAFQEEICKTKCILKGRCIEEGKDDHWYLMCPHYHSWKLKYTSWVWDSLKYAKEHPEEMDAKHKQAKEYMKKVAAERRAAKKAAKEKEKESK